MSCEKNAILLFGQRAQFGKITLEYFTTPLHHLDIFPVAHPGRKGIVHFFDVANIGTLFVNIAQRPAQMNADSVSAVEGCQLRWVLGEGGKIEVLEPSGLRAKVAAAGKRIWERNGKGHDQCR